MFTGVVDGKSVTGAIILALGSESVAGFCSPGSRTGSGSESGFGGASADVSSDFDSARG